MKFYDTSRCLYLETDTLGVRLVAGLLQVRDDMSYGMSKYQTIQLSAQLLSPAKVLSSVEWYYSNI